MGRERSRGEISGAIVTSEAGFVVVLLLAGLFLFHADVAEWARPRPPPGSYVYVDQWKQHL